MQSITLHRPTMDELLFRQQLLSDPATMSYNHAWGGTIDFPQERWADWYGRWVENPSDQRFYRYLYNKTENVFVGETAYHFDDDLNLYICDVIVRASCRGRGYGRRGLELLCEAAKLNGIERLSDNIAADNPSVSLFLKCGFCEVSRNRDYILVEKNL